VSNRLDPRVKEVFSRLWRYVIPHKLIGLIAVVAMAAGAFVEAAMVWLVEPLMDDTLVAHNLETARWLPFAFIAIFIGRGLAGFATEASLGWIGRRRASWFCDRSFTGLDRAQRYQRTAARRLQQIPYAAVTFYRETRDGPDAVSHDLQRRNGRRVRDERRNNHGA